MKRVIPYYFLSLRSQWQLRLDDIILIANIKHCSDAHQTIADGFELKLKNLISSYN